MDIKTIILVLLRRWYVAVPIALLALFVAAGSGGSPTYAVNASFLLVTPPDAEAEVISNPLVETPASVNSAANVAMVVMQTSGRRSDIADAGYATGYGFSVARADPFVTLDVAHASAEIAVESAAVLAQLFVEEIAVQQLRFGADPGALVKAELLEISEPEADFSSVRTGQATVAMAGFLLAFLAAFLVEGVVYFFGDRRREFADFNQYETDAAQYGIGGESASDFRHAGAGRGPAPLGSRPEVPELEATSSTRWIRSRSGRGTEE